MRLKITVIGIASLALIAFASCGGGGGGGNGGNGGLSNATKVSVLADAAFDAYEDAYGACFGSQNEGDTPLATALLTSLAATLPQQIRKTINEECTSETWTAIQELGDIALSVTGWTNTTTERGGTLNCTALLNYCIEEAALQDLTSVDVYIRMTSIKISFDAYGVPAYTYETGDSTIYGEHVTHTTIDNDTGSMTGQIKNMNLTDPNLAYAAAMLELTAGVSAAGFTVTGDLTGTVGNINLSAQAGGSAGEPAYTCGTNQTSATVTPTDGTEVNCYYANNCQGCH